MERELTEREREVLTAMIQHAHDSEASVTDEQRQAWLSQVKGTRWEHV